MASPEPVYVIGCAARNLQQDGTCTAPVVLPYPEAVLPPLSIEDGFIVSVAVIGCWVVGVKAKLVFRAARAGHW